MTYNAPINDKLFTYRGHLVNFFEMRCYRMMKCMLATYILGDFGQNCSWDQDRCIELVGVVGPRAAVDPTVSGKLGSQQKDHRLLPLVVKPTK